MTQELKTYGKGEVPQAEDLLRIVLQRCAVRVARAGLEDGSYMLDLRMSCRVRRHKIRTSATDRAHVRKHGQVTGMKECGVAGAGEFKDKS